MLSREDMEPLLEASPTWCLVHREDSDLYMVKGEELLEWLKQQAFDEGTTDVTAAGLRRLTVSTLPPEATLRQAMDTMQTNTTEAVCISERSRSTSKQILYGVVTLESIESFSLSSMI